MDLQKFLQLIPNSVSGDGKPFVAALKNYLSKYGAVTDEKIDDALEELTKKPNHVTNITLLELHTITDGVRSNNIQVSWDITPVEDYAKAEIWYKTDGNWTKAGEANHTQYVYQGAETGKTYYIRVVSVNKKGNAADFDTAPQASIKIKGSQYIPKAPTQFVLTWDEQGPLWKWLFEDNNYVDFFELRLDQNPGVWNDKRLDSTRETWSRANPGVRAGTAYLYIRNIFGEYSEPAVHQFNKALPKKPAKPQIVSTIDGVRIKMEALPLGCTGYKLRIKTVDSTETNEDYFETVNSEYIYFFFIGKITVSYCFMDTLGEGEWSDSITATVKAGIDIGQVPTIDYDKFSDYIKNAIDIANKQPDINELLSNNIDTNMSVINQTAESITAVVTELNKDPDKCNYSAISQLQDNILLSVKKDEVINAINISKEGIVIDGNKIHITGDTVFDNNVIVGGAIVADSIGMEHLKANSVSSAKIQANAIDSTKIKAGAVTADKIEAGAVNAQHLAADSVGADAIQAGSIIGDKIAAGTITASKMATNSVTANAILAGSVDAEKLKAGDIDLLGALAIVGGAARLDKDGLKITDSDGGYIQYNSDGMSYYDSNNYRYAQVKRMVIGSAKHGSHVTFNHPWAYAPIVLCSPTDTQIAQSTYQQANIKLICTATNVTKTGFDIQCYTTLMSGSGSGGSNSRALTGSAETTFSFSLPTTATNISIPLTVSASVLKSTGTFKYYYKNNYGNWVTDNSTSTGDVYPWVYATASLKVNDSIKSSWQSSTIYSKQGSTVLNETTTLNATFTAGSTITVVVQLHYGFQHNMPSTANYQWRYVSGGKAPSGTVNTSSNYSTSTNQVISTGSAFFLCIDANSSAYTIS